MTDFNLDPTVCCIKHCEKPVTALGMCVNHWRRNRLYGSPVARRTHSGMFQGLSADKRFGLQVIRRDGCWGWRGSVDQDGYPVFRGVVAATEYRRAHRYSYALHSGEDPEGRQVLHRCDNPTCTNPDHLFLGSNADNMADKIAKGRARVARGEDSGKAILTEDQVREILADPRTYGELGAIYGVSAGTIGSIKARASWAHVDAPLVKGSNRGHARRGVSDKLTPAIIREIRASTERGRDLAARFGISPQSVTDIRKRRSWKHVE